MIGSIYYLHPTDDYFPPVSHAATEPDGLLAVGGDLSPSRLLLAYHSGIFPWYNPGEPILWWSPSQRGILEFDNFRINRTFNKFLKKTAFTITVNQAFIQTIQHCQQMQRNTQHIPSSTWITEDMLSAYIQLHRLGNAQSIEIWDNGELCGGLYGVVVGAVFCGESMFHLKPNASRLAYAALVAWFKRHGGHFIDCQMQNNFLKTLGVSELKRDLYLKKLDVARHIDLPKSMWEPQIIDF